MYRFCIRYLARSHRLFLLCFCHSGKKLQTTRYVPYVPVPYLSLSLTVTVSTPSLYGFNELSLTSNNTANTVKQ